MRRIVRLAGLSLAGIALAGMLCVALLAMPMGKAVVAGFVERAAARSGLAVTIDRITGWPPFAVGAERIVVGDSAGPFAEITNLSLRTDLSQLLRGRFGLQELSARRIRVDRQPQLETSGGGGGGFPVVPMDLVSIGALELGPELAGRRAELSVRGGIRTAAGILARANLTATRSDGGFGELVLKAIRGEPRDPLRIDARLTEDADGIFAGLIGRKAAPEFDMKARAEISAGAIAGEISLSSAGSTVFSGHIRLRTEQTGSYRLQVQGGGTLEDIVPAAVATLAPGEVTIDIDAAVDRGERGALPRIAIARGVVRTGAVRIEALGTLDGAKSDLQLSANIASEGGRSLAMPVPGGRQVRLDGLSLRGIVAPRNDRLRLDLVGNLTGLSVDEMTIPALGVSLAAEADAIDAATASKLPFALRVEADALQISGSHVVAGPAEPLVVEAEGMADLASLASQVEIVARAAGQRISFSGDIAREQLTGRIEAAQLDLERLADVVPFSPAGVVSAYASGTFLDGGKTDLQVEITSRDLEVGGARLSSVLAGEIRINARLRADEKLVRIDDLMLDGDSVSAAGHFASEDGALDVRIAGQIADTGVLADKTAGALRFEATAGGIAERPEIRAEITMPEGEILGRPISGASVLLVGAPGEGGWTGSLVSSGEYANQPLSGDIRLVHSAESGRLIAEPIAIAIADNRVTGSLARQIDGLLDGRLDIDAPDVAALAALAFVEASGSVAMDLSLAPKVGRQSAAFGVDARALSVEGFAIGEARGAGQVEALFSEPQLVGELALKQLTSGGLRIDDARITASTSGQGSRFAILARGPDLTLACEGSLVRAAGSTLATFDRLEGTVHRIPIALSEPGTVRISDETRVEARATVGGGDVTLAGAVTPRIDLIAGFSGLPLSTLNAVSPALGAEGSASGRVAVRGTPAVPVIDWSVEATGFQVAQTRSAGLPPFDVSARGAGSTDATNVEADISGSGIALAISGDVPVRSNGLDVRGQGTVPLSVIAASAGRELRLGGTASVDVRVSGSIDAPAITGTVDLADALVGDPATGIGITGGSGRIRLNGTQATLEQLSGRLLQGGTLTASGAVNLDPRAGLPAELSLNVVDGRYADGEIVNTTFSADLGITGALLGTGTVAGAITLGRTEIALPDRIVSRSTAIEVEHRNSPPAFKPPLAKTAAAKRSAPGSQSLRLDLQLLNKGGIFVRGFGLDAALAGSLALRGSSVSPEAVGAFETTRGRFTFLGRRLDIDSGRLTFGGDLIPFLDFSATTSVESTSIVVQVTGPADKPEIVLTSSPELPDEEILSLLLFNRTLTNLSAFQAAQLVDAVAQYSGATGSGGVFDRIRQATGLDDLDISQDAEGNTTVRAGRRLTDNLRVGVEQGSSSDSGRVTIDLDIARGLRARGEAGSDGEGKLGLTYEREY